MHAGPESPLVCVSGPRAVYRWPERAPHLAGCPGKGVGRPWEGHCCFLPGWRLYNVQPVTTVQSWPSGLQVHCAPGPAVPPPGCHSSTPVLAAPALVWFPPSSSGGTKAVSSLPAPATCLGCWSPAHPPRPRGRCPHISEGSCQHPQPSWHCVACRIKSNPPPPMALCHQAPRSLPCSSLSSGPVLCPRLL